MTAPLNKAIDCCDSELRGWRNRWIGCFERGRLGYSTSYNTAKNSRHFHLLFCRDLAVVFDTF